MAKFFIIYLRQMFPSINDAKINEGIFVGPQIRHIINHIRSSNRCWWGQRTLSGKHSRILWRIFLVTTKPRITLIWLTKSFQRTNTGTLSVYRSLLGAVLPGVVVD